MPLSYGKSTGLGGRASQQDQLLVVENLFGNSEYYLFGVFDGHGLLEWLPCIYAATSIGSEGRTAADFAKGVVPEIINSLEEIYKKDPVAALKTLFETINTKMCDDPSLDAYMSGSTCSVAVITDSQLAVANVGDSRVIIALKDGDSQEYQTLQLSRYVRVY